MVQWADFIHVWFNFWAGSAWWLGKFELIARLGQYQIRAFGLSSARVISKLSFWALLGSSNIKLVLLGSARLQQIKIQANLARLRSTKNCWLDHPWTKLYFLWLKTPWKTLETPFGKESIWWQRVGKRQKYCQKWKLSF